MMYLYYQCPLYCGILGDYNYNQSLIIIFYNITIRTDTQAGYFNTVYA